MEIAGSTRSKNKLATILRNLTQEITIIKTPRLRLGVFIIEIRGYGLTTSLTLRVDNIIERVSSDAVDSECNDSSDSKYTE